jgi:hypothetical protein
MAGILLIFRGFSGKPYNHSSRSNGSESGQSGPRPLPPQAFGVVVYPLPVAPAPGDARPARRGLDPEAQHALGQTDAQRQLTRRALRQLDRGSDDPGPALGALGALGTSFSPPSSRTSNAEPGMSTPQDPEVHALGHPPRGWGPRT